MRRVLVGLALLVLSGGAVFWAVTRPGSGDPAALEGLAGDASRGEAVFWAGGCASCHAAPGAEGAARLVLSGGQVFASGFGSFVAPNISPDPREGIGAWSDLQFVTAMQRGISPEGRHYYPAFPYAAYRLASVQDMLDLRAFLAVLPASDVPSLPHDVGFPWSISRAVGLWNLLYLRDDFAVAGDLAEPATRGRYLAEALAHCGECHTPRTALGGLDRGRWLEGAPDPTGDGTIPGLTPAVLSWSEADIAAYLRDGFTPEFDSAGGHMADVVLNLAQLDDADRAAIASYLKALPATADEAAEAPPQY